MFNVTTENGKVSILSNNTLIFGDLKLKMHQSHGDSISQEFSDIKRSKDEIGFLYDDEKSRSSLTVTVDNNILAIRVDAMLKPERPLFKKQVFLQRDLGISVQLQLHAALKYTAIYQHKDWWLRPAFFYGANHIPDRTQLLMWQQADEYYAMVAAAGVQYRSDIAAGEGGIRVKMSSNCESLPGCHDLAVVISKGKDPHKCCEDAVKAVLRYSGSPNTHRKNKKYPEVFNYFGWCSWDAFYHKVNEEGIIQKVDELQKKEIPVKWILIDDGWSEADYEKQELIGLDSDKTKFPGGIAGVVQKLKDDYAIDYVGVWQAFMGYWNGVKPDSRADRILTENMEVLPDGRHIPIPEKSFDFWNTWHRYLLDCGIDFVKVDGQSAVSLFYSGYKTYGEASRKMQAGLEASAALNFDRNIINCMGMAPEDMWNRSRAAIARSSDDFVPEVKHGFREHAIQNAYNSLLHGQLYWGDWDMFWSSHDENWQNSVLRAVSGGPVYISDGLNNTNPQYIRPLVLDNGLILKCEEVGLPTADCIFTDPITTAVPLKLFNRYKDSYVVAAFNINQDESQAVGTLAIQDIPQMPEDEYYVYNYRNQTVEQIDRNQSAALSIQPNDAEIYLLIPKKTRMTPIGILDKYVATATIQDVFIFEHHDTVVLKQQGIFGFISDTQPKCVTVNGRETAVIKGNGLYAVSCEENRPVIDLIW